MDDDTIRKLTGQAQIDQASAGLTNFAAMLGSFYAGLIDGGMPDMLASDLTQDWFRMQVHKMLWPDAPPPMWE